MSLEILGASKRYGDVLALDDVSLVLADHQVHAILGPSGSGKSTLLQTICGLERLDCGTIRWRDTVFQRDHTSFLSPEKRQIGMVFQDFALFPHLTVAQNITFGLMVRRWSRDRVRDRLHELIKLLHLEGLQERYPHELSGGQKQRTAVARALAPDPDLLLLDESLSSLDAALRRTLQYELRDLFTKLHLTVILVTHDPTEALVMADNIIVMNQGRIMAMNHPRTLYERPDSAVTAQLMGLVTLWPGQVVENRGQYVVVDLDGLRVAIPATDLSVGTKVMTVIRPSSCQVTSSAESGIDVQVKQVVYLGDYFLVTGQYGVNTLHFYLHRPPKERETIRFNPEKLWCYPVVEDTNGPLQHPPIERRTIVGR